VSGDVVKVGQVWDWDCVRGPFTITDVVGDGVLYRYADGFDSWEKAKIVAANATLVTDVSDAEPTPLDALAAAAVAYEARQASWAMDPWRDDVLAAALRANGVQVDAGPFVVDV
jgi:hypothetical protein